MKANPSSNSGVLMVNNIHPASQQPAQGAKQSQAAVINNVGVDLVSKSKVATVNDDKSLIQKTEGVASVQEIQSAVDELNTRLESQEIQVNFDVDDETGRIIVKVTDSESGETIRQIPSEATLEFAHNASKGVGITLDGTF